MAIEMAELARRLNRKGYKPASEILSSLGKSLYKLRLIPYSLNSDIEAPLGPNSTVFDALLQPSLPEIPTRVGTIARLIRTQRSETAREVAERAGMSANHLLGIEKLSSEPTERKIVGLASALGVRVGRLFGE